MKNLKVKSVFFNLVAIMVVAVFLTSCEQDSILDDVSENINNSDFKKLITNNLSADSEEDLTTLNLSVEDFKTALQLATGTSNTDSFFEDEEIRKAFRQKMIDALAGDNTQSRSYCGGSNYFAEAYSSQEGYISSTSNSFAYARRIGQSGLWAASFDCNTLEEESRYYGNCSYASGCCMVRALYYSGGGRVNLFGLSPSYCL